MFFRGYASAMADAIGRPMTLKRGGAELATFSGVLRGLTAAELVNSADQGDMLLFIPAAQIGVTVPKKFDRVIAKGREFTIQRVRECYDGEELAAFKAYVRG